MAFSFGSSGQTPFGSTPAKPAAFGAPLSFGTPATTASAGFGGFGSSFGATSQPQSTGFGAGFGTPATGAAAPTFGSTFGQPVASTAPTFGSSFGTPASSAAPAFGSTFGATSSAGTGLFGNITTTKPNLFGTSSTSAPSLFSTPATSTPGLFGQTASTQAPSLFGGTSTTPSLFSTTTSTTPSFFGSSFGTTGTTPAPNIFGSGAGLGLGTSIASTGTTGFNLFGSTTTTSAPSLFSGFGATQPSSAGFSGFGNTGFPSAATSTTGSLFGNTFGAKPTAAGVPNADIQNQQLLASFYAINVFGDERDNILKKWNMIQACWGTGKGFYNANQQPVEYNHTNPFYRFKAVGYKITPKRDNSDGIVKLVFNKKEVELRNQKDVLVNGIWGILGNKPNLTVSVEDIRSMGDAESDVLITVSEKGITGNSKKIPATDLAAYLNQAVQKQQLTNVGVTLVCPYICLTKSQVEEYLKKPPPGIDAQMWQAAQIDNPDPQKFLPVAINGFSDIKQRILCEEYENGLNMAFLEKVNNEIVELKKKHASSLAQIAEYKQKFLVLQHRVLRILVKQEVTRKAGLALTPEEENLRGRYEVLYTHLNNPVQFRGKINELISKVKMIGNLEVQSQEKYRMDPKMQEEIKQFLKMEQNGIAHLINLINTDLKNLKIIMEGMNEFIQKK